MDASLVTRLEDDDRSRTVTAFPDGSVDYFYDVLDGGSRLGDRDRFAERIGTGHSPAFTLDRRAVEPGGHAVNMAAQADLLGEDVALVGHVDDPVFDGATYETYSMGAPAQVGVYGFDDGDVLLVDPSDEIRSWSFADVRDATDDAFESLFSADVVFGTNWTSFDAMPAALSDLAATDVDGDYFVFDPGGMAERTRDEVTRLFDALSALGGAYDVVLAANGAEIDVLAAALAGDDVGDRAAALARLREAGDLAAAVLHETEAALAVTRTETARVENVAVDPVRNTGGGDRFDAGLSYALARDWSWTDALELGNACASRYVATGESATPTELAAFLRERD